MGRFGVVAAAMAGLMSVSAVPVRAASADPAAAQVDTFDAALLDVMKAAKSLGGGWEDAPTVGPPKAP